MSIDGQAPSTPVFRSSAASAGAPSTPRIHVNAPLGGWPLHCPLVVARHPASWSTVGAGVSGSGARGAGRGAAHGLPIELVCRAERAGVLLLVQFAGVFPCVCRGGSPCGDDRLRAT